MVRRFLSYVGLRILTLLLIVCLLVMGILYERIGLIKLPANVKSALAWRPQPQITIQVQGQPGGAAVWQNPLDGAPAWTPEPTSMPLPPTPAPTQTPWPTPSPVPPLDPAVYRTEVLLRLKRLAAALEHWLELNQQLGGNWVLIDDPAWQAEMSTTLGDIQSNGRSIGEVTPAPVEYSGIQALLEQVARNAQELVDNYTLALQTRESAHFSASGDSFQRLKAYLAEAVNAMLEAGWVIN